MNRRNFLKYLLGTSVLLTTAPQAILAKPPARTKPPNIVFFLADDLGWHQLGCYGSAFYQTPNIDNLASQGMRFTAAYAAGPVCSPTRASIMTGKYPARLHLTDFIPGGEPPADSKLQHPNWTKYLPLEQITIAEVLTQNQYKTACFGKWHLSVAKTPPESLPFNPGKQGFDQSFVTYKPDRSLARDWQTPENDGHNVEIITLKSLEFIRKNKNKPFFLYVSHNTIHTPLMEKKDLIRKYEADPAFGFPENNAVVAAMLETLDNSVGRLLQQLDELNLADNTIVIFFSDNGGLEKSAAQTPLRSGKANLYEGGIRVPLIIRWPGKINPGSTCDEPVTSVDFFPTLLEIVGSKTKHRDLDGTSLVPLLTQSGSLNRDAIYWHYPHYHSAGAGPAGAIRQGDYKLIEWYERTLLNQENQVELYNLKQDIGESDNLAEKMPEQVREMRAKLRAWRDEVGAQMPVVAGDQ